MNPEESEPLSKSQADPASPNGAGGKAAPNGNGANPPDGVPPAAAELIDDIDAYQRRIEREWESAKSVYQSRISEIMDDFLKKGASETAPNGNGSASHKAEGPAPESIDSIVARVANELRSMDSGRRRPAAAAPARPMLPGPAPRSALHRRAGAIALGAVLVVAAVLGLRMPEWTPLPYAHSGAITAANGKIYVADWLRKTLYVHAAKRGAPILSVESLPVGLMAGLQVDSEGLWTVDGLTHEILRHAASTDHQVTDRYPAPDDKPAGLILDGSDLWTAGLESKMLYRLRADNPAEVRDKFDLPLANVTALQMQNKRLWVLDGKARELTVFRLQKPLKTLATFDLDPFLRGATPTGFSLSGSTAWIVTENPSAIARVPLSRIKKSKSPEF